MKSNKKKSAEPEPLEIDIRTDFIKMIRRRGWLTKIFVCNELQIAVPDLYIHHPVYSGRWCDTKRPITYDFTDDQLREWPVWEHFNCGIWIITGADEENYQRLFEKPNWRQFLKPRHIKKMNTTVMGLIDELFPNT